MNTNDGILKQKRKKIYITSFFLFIPEEKRFSFFSLFAEAFDKAKKVMFFSHKYQQNNNHMRVHYNNS